MRFMWFSYYKTTNHTTPCDALLLAMRYGYVILQAIFVRFLRFLRFGEHPYSTLSFALHMHH